jgi:glucose/arabinose dehydrogenase
MKKTIIIILVLILIAVATGTAIFYWRNFRGAAPAFKKPPEDITKLISTTGMPLILPTGFSISIFAKDLGNPRVVIQDQADNLVVSIPSQGRVVVLPDKDRDGVADEVVDLVENLNRPHGLAFRCLPSDSKENCKLYIAETDKVVTYDYDAESKRATNRQELFDLPAGGRHWTRTIKFMPEPYSDKLLISVGSSCDVCEEKDWRRAKILIANVDGSDLRIFASGLRNAVFMTFHPKTKKVWTTEMGRDFLGDDLPPDEINIVEEGENYGWPYCYGRQVHDARFDFARSMADFCQETIPSYIDIPAHSAPLGLAFVPENWPEEYRNDLLVLYHGSWNRSVPTGYKVVRYQLDSEGNYLGVEDFISGWLTEKEEALGRPADILVQLNGVIYISDDKAGVIYRVVYEKLH